MFPEEAGCIAEQIIHSMYFWILKFGDLLVCGLDFWCGFFFFRK